MLTGFYLGIGFCFVVLVFTLWYDYWYTPRHKKK